MDIWRVLFYYFSFLGDPLAMLNRIYWLTQPLTNWKRKNVCKESYLISNLRTNFLKTLLERDSPNLNIHSRKLNRRHSNGKRFVLLCEISFNVYFYLFQIICGHLMCVESLDTIPLTTLSQSTQLEWVPVYAGS